MSARSPYPDDRWGGKGREPEDAMEPMMESGMPLPEAVMVDIGGMQMDEVVDGARITGDGENGFVVDFEPEEGEDPNTDAAALEHGANLAEHLGEGALSKMAQDVCEWVEADLRSRADWYERLKYGLELLGVVQRHAKSEAFKLVEKVNHPLIAEGAVQFQARASSELLPPGGPAKGAVLGEKTKDIEDQAERVANYINYQVAVEDPDHYLESEKMLFMLGLEGSQFKKVDRDELVGMNVSRWIRGEDFIVPYSAVSLQSAPRYTHRMFISQNDMRKFQARGYYRDVDLGQPTGDPVSGDDSKLSEKRDEAEGKSDTSNLIPGDAEHTVLECCCDYDIPGFEDLGQDGQPTGIELPYVISVDLDSQKTISIRRNWKEGDALRKKRVKVVHYPNIPGGGFYSYGWIHLIAGLGEAATGLLQTVMLGAAFASIPGGAKSKDAKFPGSFTLEFGKYQECEMTADELQRAFWEPKFQGPNESMFKVLGLLIDAGQRFMNTNDQMVGDAKNTGPVGTTVALIEQGQKVMSGVHKRLHAAQAIELRLLMELDGQYVPEEGYPYRVQNADRQILRSDFDDRVDVVPVSDPNIFSNTQRLAIAQTMVQRSDASPGLYDRRKVERRFLEALRVPDPDDVLASMAKPSRCDPVTENAYLLVGKPVRAYVDQHHEAHIAVHMDQLRRLEAEASPLIDRVATPSLNHIAEHKAHLTRVQMFQQMGIPMPPASLTDDDDDRDSYPQIPPQIEFEISARAAAAVQQMPPPADQKEQMIQQKMAEIQKQAEGLQKQAEALAQERERLEDLKEEAERTKMAAEASKRELALRTQIEALRRQMEQMKNTGERRAVIEEALRRVEGALTKKSKE